MQANRRLKPGPEIASGTMPATDSERLNRAAKFAETLYDVALGLEEFAVFVSLDGYPPAISAQGT